MKTTPKINIDQKRQHKYKPDTDGYCYQNGGFVFSDNLIDWMQSKVRRNKRFPNLF